MCLAHPFLFSAENVREVDFSGKTEEEDKEEEESTSVASVGRSLMPSIQLEPQIVNKREREHKAGVVDDDDDDDDDDAVTRL